jgi:hypothetical protein
LEDGLWQVLIDPKPRTTTVTRLLLCTALALVLGTGAAQAKRLPEECADCIDRDPDGTCLRVWAHGCTGEANPFIIAALKKRYPDADEIWVSDDSPKQDGRIFVVSFMAASGNMACRMTLRPIRFSKCRRRHA